MFNVYESSLLGKVEGDQSLQDLVSVNGNASVGLVQLESAVCSGEGAVVVYLRSGYRYECR